MLLDGDVTGLQGLREIIIQAEDAVGRALEICPRPFGKGNDGAEHLQNALDELRRARLFADVYVDVAQKQRVATRAS